MEAIDYYNMYMYEYFNVKIIIIKLFIKVLLNFKEIT